MKKEIDKHDVLCTLGKNIKKIRLLKGLSQESLDNDLQKSVNFISLVENGKTGLSVQTLVDICDVLDVDVNSLFAGIISPASTNNDSFDFNTLKLFEEKDKNIVNNLINYIIDSKN